LPLRDECNAEVVSRQLWSRYGVGFDLPCCNGFVEPTSRIQFVVDLTWRFAFVSSSVCIGSILPVAVLYLSISSFRTKNDNANWNRVSHWTDCRNSGLVAYFRNDDRASPMNRLKAC
jgi:hypothetical protein